jgi:hypothetical protein
MYLYWDYTNLLRVIIEFWQLFIQIATQATQFKECYLEKPRYKAEASSDVV